jgi:hypothetical protein
LPFLFATELKPPGWNIFLSYQNNVNNLRLAEATAALADAQALPGAHTAEIKQAEKAINEAEKKRRDLREEEGGGALGVGTRMGWS